MISSVPKHHFFSGSQEIITNYETENKADDTASPEILEHIDSQNTVIPNTIIKNDSTVKKSKTPAKSKKKPKKEKQGKNNSFAKKSKCCNDCCNKCCYNCLFCFAMFCDCLGC